MDNEIASYNSIECPGTYIISNNTETDADSNGSDIEGLGRTDYQTNCYDEVAIKSNFSCDMDEFSQSNDSIVTDNFENDSNCRFDCDSKDYSNKELLSSSDRFGSQLSVKHFVQMNRSKKLRECPLCFHRQSEKQFPHLASCNHRSCKSCLLQYLKVEIMESRVQITCPECSELLYPSDIYMLMASHPDLIEKYENFSLRRALMTDPDTRWCPAPDCSYAVIASSCAACPELKCQKCGTLYCYHCKGPWHASQTCDEARRERGRKSKGSVTRRRHQAVGIQLKRGDIKPCPRCRAYILKLDDGSCNHMVCAMCSAQFCWLCLREINDLHYFSPTGCTFWGRKPWTRKKKLLWQVGTLIGAPVGIALIAGLAIPGIFFGVPVFVGRKVNQRLAQHSKLHRRLLTAGSVVGSFIVSPVLAIMAVGVGVPIMLAYAYGVVPLSLCRNGFCGFGANPSSTDRTDFDVDEIWHDLNGNEEKSRLINEVERLDDSSLITGIASLGEKCNYEEASAKAMAGSQYCDDKSVYTVGSGREPSSYYDEAASMTALAGSVLESKLLPDNISEHVTALMCSKDSERSSSSNHTSSASDQHLIEDLGSSGNYYTGTCYKEPIFAASKEEQESTCRLFGRAPSSVSSGSRQIYHSNFHCSHSSTASMAELREKADVKVVRSVEQLILLGANDSAISAQPSTSKSINKETALQTVSPSARTILSGEENGSDEANADRFRIRALFDAMKQIVSDDVASDSDDEHVSNSIWLNSDRSLSNGLCSMLLRPRTKSATLDVSANETDENSLKDSNNRTTPTSISRSRSSFYDRRRPKWRFFSTLSRKSR